MPTRWLVELGGPKQVIEEARDISIPTDARRERVLPDVLVYLNERLVRYGQACNEYIDQMNSGIRDAIHLGVPVGYFKNTVRQWIPKRETLHNTSQRWNPRSLTHYQAPRLPTTRLYGSTDSWSEIGKPRYWAPRRDSDWNYRTTDVVVEVRHYRS